MADAYKGPERRRQPRREKADRREDVRFEPDREPRRNGRGRRKEDELFGRR